MYKLNGIQEAIVANIILHQTISLSILAQNNSIRAKNTETKQNKMQKNTWTETISSVSNLYIPMLELLKIKF